MTRILIVGCGNMGASHARAYCAMDNVVIVGLVSKGDSKKRLSGELGLDVPLYEDVEPALRETQPDAVCISTYPDSHERFAVAALEFGCHVFLEKPIASTTEGAGRVIAAAVKANRQLVVGYILRHHPSWQKFIEVAGTLGRPLVMRMNLNQQSFGEAWRTHQSLLQSVSPIVDCGVHYIDVMCQMVRSRPVRVFAIGARLDESLPPGRCNYGQLQIVFDDGSVGWYEAGWGPMMSETAFFVKDVIGPRGAASIQANRTTGSSTVEGHVQAEAIHIHHAELDASGAFARPDEWLHESDDLDQETLCRYEQEFFLSAIRDRIDLSAHLADSFASLAIVVAADESIATGRVVELSGLALPFATAAPLPTATHADEID